jgi:hypothetical protein
MFKEATRLLRDSGAVHAGLPAPLGDGLIREEDVADDLIVVLHRVGEAQGQLLKALGGRHDAEHASVTRRSLVGRYAKM